MLALGKRGLALRGTWDKDTRVEDGNFNFFIKWKSKFDAVLKPHLDTASRNATYLSPQIQNELIASIEEEIRKAIFFFFRFQILLKFNLLQVGYIPLACK